MTPETEKFLRQRLTELEARVSALEAVFVAEDDSLDEWGLESQHQEFVARIRSLREQ